MAGIKNLIVDMDGVLWRGETPTPGLEAFFETLQQLEMDFVLATNNATKTAAQYVEKLARFGVAVTADRILNSAEATALYLSQRYPAGSRVYVIGESGLHQALAAQDFDLLETEGLVGDKIGAELVVVGLSRHVCYPQLASAAHFINNGAQFVATNPDVTFPSEVGPLPGAGALLAFIREATGVEPTVVGKPNQAIFEEALRRLNSVPADTAMVGDRLSTDIAGARAAGLQTILVLTGVSDRADVGNDGIRPDYVFEDITALADYLLK